MQGGERTNQSKPISIRSTMASNRAKTIKILNYPAAKSKYFMKLHQDFWTIEKGSSSHGEEEKRKDRKLGINN